MASTQTPTIKKVSTVGIKDPIIRRVVEELAARVAALELANAGRGE